MRRNRDCRSVSQGHRRGMRQPALERRPAFEVLEVRSLLAIDISNFQLVVDNGTSTADGITSDPRVTGIVGGEFTAPEATHAAIQFDHDGDGVVEGEVTSTTIAASFTYDPRPTGLASGQNVNLRYRAVELDDTDTVVETGQWTSFSFSFAESSRGAIEVRQATTNLVHDQSNVSFGSTPLGAPVAKTFTVRNTGAGALDLTSRMLVPDGFTLETPIGVDSLAPWQETTFALRLDAAVQGSYAGDVYFFNGDVDESPYHFTVDGAVTASQAKVEVDSIELTSGVSSVDFGHVSVGAPVDKTITVTNLGDYDLVLGEPIAVPSGFSVVSSFGSTTLSPNQSTTFTLRLDAATAGFYAGDLTFAANDPDANPFSFAVRGRVALPEIEITLAGQPLADGSGVVSFGHACGTVSRTLTIHNTGLGDLILNESVTLPDGFRVASGFGATTLLPNQSTTLVVEMYATAPGEYSGPLVITSNDLDSGSFDLTVVGEVYRPDIVIAVGGEEVASGGTIDFGASAAAQGVTRTIVVSNVGSNVLNLSALPPMPSGFSLVSDLGVTTLTPGTSTTFDVQFDAGAAGATSGELVIGSNDPNEAQYNLLLAGTALQLNVGLLNDTGVYQDDAMTSDPRVAGAILGPLEGIQFVVEIDLDQDGEPDSVVPPEPGGSFVYLAPDLVEGAVNLAFRINVWNEVQQAYLSAEWSQVDFTLETGTDQDPSVIALGLRVNTGSPTDSITSNPMLVGRISNDGRVEGYLVEIDLNNDSQPDAEAYADANGDFGYYPAGIMLGTRTVQARALESRFDDTTAIGAWLSFTFTLVDPALPTVPELELKRDTGSLATDGVTFDPTLVGSVVTEGNWQLTDVEFDYDNDGEVDGTAGIDSAGHFEHAPYQLAVGSYDVRARAIDRLNDLVGPWTAILDVTLVDVPLPTIDSLVLANDTGASSTDKITSDSTVEGVISSEVTVGNQRIEFDVDGDGLVDASTYTDENGAFEYDPGWLGQGEKTVRARSTVYDLNAGEHRSGQWVSLTFTLEPPSAPVVQSLALANDTGTSNTDLITWDPTVVGAVVNGSPLPFRRVEFDENGDGQVDGQVYSDEAGNFRYRPVALAAGTVTIAARGVDYDPSLADFVTGAWLQLTFELEEYEGLATPPPPDAVQLRDDAALAADDGADSNADAVLPAIGDFNAAIGSSLPGATGIDLGIGYYVFLWDLHDGSVPHFGAFGFDSGLPAAAGVIRPIFVSPTTGTPVAVNYSGLIPISEIVGAATIIGDLDYSYVVEVFPATQTFTIDVVVDYAFSYDQTGSPEIHLTGGYHFDFQANGNYWGTAPDISISGTYSTGENGWYSGTWTDGYASLINSATEDTTVTGNQSTSLSYSFLHDVPTGSFSSTPSGSSVSGGFLRQENASYFHARNETVDYSLNFFGDEKTGLSHANHSTSHSYSLWENGSYDAGTGIRDVSAFVWTETGGYATHYDDSADFLLQYNPGQLTGEYDLVDSLSYSYSRLEAGDYEVGPTSYSINGDMFTRNESAGETHDVTGSASFTANVTGYQESAAASITRTAAGDFSYTATGDYTVTNTSLSVNGDSFWRTAGGDTSMTLSASGSFSRSDAYGESHGPYSVSQAITAAADQVDLGSFSIDNVGIYSNGTADETGSLDASQTHSHSLSYSKVSGVETSHGTMQASSSSTLTIDYDDTITYSAAPTGLSATGHFNFHRQNTGDSATTGSKSYAEVYSGTNNHGSVNGENSGSSSESYSETGNYSIAGNDRSRDVDYTLDELNLSDNSSTHSRTYATGIQTTTSVSGTVTSTGSFTANSGTIISKPSGSSSYSAHETGTYSEGPSTVSLSVNFSAHGSRTQQSSATATLSLDHTGYSFSPGAITEGFHHTLESDSLSTSSKSLSFSKSYHVPTADLTLDGSGVFLENESSNTESTLDKSRTYTYTGSMALLMGGAYTSSEPSVEGVLTSHSDSSVSNSLSETGTFTLSGLDRGMKNELRTGTAVEQAVTTGNETYRDTGSYLDNFGGTFSRSNSSQFTLTSSQSAIAATNNVGGSPYISTNSQSGSFSVSQSAYSIANSKNTRGFIEPDLAGHATVEMNSTATHTALETGAYHYFDTTHTKTISFTLDDNSNVSTTTTENGNYGSYCFDSVTFGYGVGCALMTSSAPAVQDPSSGGGKTGTVKDSVKAFSVKTVHEQGNRSIDHGTETRVANFTIDDKVTETPSFYTSYSHSVYNKEGRNDGTYILNSVGWKTASLTETGSYTETPGGMTKTAYPTFTESLFFRRSDSDIGVAKETLTNTSVFTTSTASYTYRELLGLGGESYSHQGTYSTSPSFSASTGAYHRDNWNVRFGNDSVTTTYTRTESSTVTTGSVTEGNNTLRIYLYKEGGTYTPGSAGRTETGTFKEYELNGGNAAVTGSGNVDYGGTRNSTFEETKGSTDDFYYGSSGSFERLPCGDFRSFEYSHRESNTGSSTYKESGEGSGFSSSSARRWEGDGVYSWGYPEYVPSNPFGDFAPEEFTFTESGVRRFSYTEEGKAETSNTFTTSASADYSEDSYEDNQRFESVSAAAGPTTTSVDLNPGTETTTVETSGNESYSRSMTSSFTANGALNVTPWSSATFGSGCASSGTSGGEIIPEDPVGSRDGSFTQNYSKGETLTRTEHWSASATHDEPYGGATLTANLNEFKTIDKQEFYSEWGDYSDPIFADGSGEDSSSSSGFAYKSATHVQQDLFTSVHTNTDSGTGEGSATLDSSDGSPAFSTLSGENWNETQRSTASHSFGHEGWEETGGPVNDSGEHHETYTSSFRQVYTEGGGIFTPDYYQDLGENRGSTYWSTFEDNGTYIDGQSQGLEVDDRQGMTWDGLSTFTNPVSSPDSCTYPPPAGEEPCHAVGGREGISWETILDWTQTTLDVLGFVPGPIGMIADAINTGISLARGDYQGALLNAISIIPALGDAAKAAKMGANALEGAAKLADAAKTVGKVADGAIASGKSGMGVGRAAGNFAGTVGKMSDTTKGVSNLGDGVGTVGKMDAPNCGTACKAGEGCFVGDTLVVLRPLTPEEQAESQSDIAQPTQGAADQTADASSAPVAVGAAVAGVVGLGLAVAGDMRRNKRAAAVDDAFSDGGNEDWFGPEEDPPSDVLGDNSSKHWLDELCDELFANPEARALGEADETKDALQTPRPTSDFESAACATATVPHLSVRQENTPSIVHMKPRPRASERIGHGMTCSWLRCAGIALAIAGFALCGSFLLRPEEAPPPSAGTKPTSHAASAPQYLTKPIQDIEVIRDRVLADNPEIDGDAPSDFGAIDSQSWRILQLAMTKPNGGLLKISLARPREWINDHRTPNGHGIYLELPEIGISGVARIEWIAECSQPPKGTGRLVTGKFQHQSQEIIDIYVEGQDNPIGTTANHPFWSQDRRQFVAAGHLRAGERLRAADGSEQRLLSIVPRPGLHPVWNLEVDGEHVFYVGPSGLLVHNSYPKNPIYRALSDDDLAAFQAGLPLKPKGKINDPELHVQNRPTLWISASETIEGARHFDKGRGIAEIDTALLQATGSRIMDHGNLLQHLKDAQDIENATRATEVLIKNGIDPSAIRRIIPSDG